MNVHKNARLTPAGRARMIQRVQAGESPRQVDVLPTGVETAAPA